MTQIQVGKLTQHVVTGPDSNEVSVSKLAMFVLLVPGESSGEEATRQAHIYAQKIRRG